MSRKESKSDSQTPEKPEVETQDPEAPETSDPEAPDENGGGEGDRSAAAGRASDPPADGA